VISVSMHRYRLAIIRLCCSALLLLGAGAQLHSLAHAVQATQAAAHHDGAAAHTQACEQCLQYAALDGALRTAEAARITPVAGLPTSTAPGKTQRAATVVAYRSRAPPTNG
jgi:hypothetical protein